MNIAFFLTPKAEVAWVKSTSTLRQAIERMEHHKYTAVPVLLPDVNGLLPGRGAPAGRGAAGRGASVFEACATAGKGAAGQNRSARKSPTSQMATRAPL